MQEMALQVNAMSGSSPGYRGMVCATPRHPGGLEADLHVDSDPSLPPPDFHHYANAHGFLSDGARALATGHNARLSGHAATMRPRNAAHGFLHQDSSGGKKIVCRDAASPDHAREV
jgi:hypothetical protein